MVPGLPCWRIKVDQGIVKQLSQLLLESSLELSQNLSLSLRNQSLPLISMTLASIWGWEWVRREA